MGDRVTNLINFPAYTIRRNCPQHWTEDRTGLVARSIDYYNRQICGNPRSLCDRYHQEQISVLRDYFEHYITAPVWDIFEYPERLEELREMIGSVRSISQLRQWHLMAIATGFDPF
jgi:hypothetical protein